ncbi:MAG: EamA family transporter [Ilumatobacteraceae bacterium]|nr:EamA family transporter [Ilumatobacteraceae bacterium]
MGILLGSIAAFLFGSSDVLAARGSRTDRPIAVTRTALLVALVFTPLFLAIKPWHIGGADLAYSSLSGVLNGFALLAVYVGYTRAPIGVVAPLASVLTAMVPVFVDLLRGNGLSPLSGVGVVIGLAAVVLSTYVPGGRGPIRYGLIAGILGGIGFGLAFTCLDLTSDAAGIAPVPIQRLTGLLFLTLVHPLMKTRWIVVSGPGRKFAIGTGLVAGLAMGALQLGYRYGDAGPVSVAASQFAAVTVLLSAFLNRERLRWWQGTGLALASVGVALMAIG